MVGCILHVSTVARDGQKFLRGMGQQRRVRGSQCKKLRFHGRKMVSPIVSLQEIRGPRPPALLFYVCGVFSTHLFHTCAKFPVSVALRRKQHVFHG